MSETLPGGEGSVIRGRVEQALREVIDPEVGINIVDLGLVYRIAVEGARVEVTMTMTSPACPLGDYLSGEAERAIRAHVPAAEAVKVTIVLEPAWSPEKMSDTARRQLGWNV
jgi:metal-sulfur cluster biosynthetic enzyme